MSTGTLRRTGGYFKRFNNNKIVQAIIDNPGKALKNGCLSNLKMLLQIVQMLSLFNFGDMIITQSNLKQ